MSVNAHLLALKNHILKQNANKFRIIRRSAIINNKHVIFFDIQKKRKFLIFEWWSTVRSGYNHVRQARHDALNLIIDGDSKI